MRTKIIGGVLAAALAILIPFLMKLEGRSLRAYLDPVGVWTICDGETLGVKPGDVKTHAECDQLSKDRMTYFLTEVDKMVIPEISAMRLAALTSFAYNIGLNGFQRSQVLKLINQGRYNESCNAMMNWYTAGGRDCRKRENNCYGLINRRNAEINLCLRG